MTHLINFSTLKKVKFASSRPERVIEEIKNRDCTLNEIIKPMIDLNHECSFIKEKEKEPIGLRIHTPYSYVLFEGCNMDIPCLQKNLQVLYYGLYLDIGKLRTNFKDLWLILNGEIEVKDKGGLIKLLKRQAGYIENCDKKWRYRFLRLSGK